MSETSDLTELVEEIRVRNSTKEVRNAKIKAEVASGRQVSAVAKENNISRQQVYNILSASDSEKIIKEYRSRLTESIGKAFNRIMTSLEHDFDGKGLTAALAIFKTYGLIQDKVDVTHHGEVKHYATITLLDGRKIEMKSVFENEDKTK